MFIKLNFTISRIPYNQSTFAYNLTLEQCHDPATFKTCSGLRFSTVLILPREVGLTCRSRRHLYVFFFKPPQLYALLHTVCPSFCWSSSCPLSVDFSIYEWHDRIFTQNTSILCNPEGNDTLITGETAMLSDVFILFPPYSQWSTRR